MKQLRRSPDNSIGRISAHLVPHAVCLARPDFFSSFNRFTHRIVFHSIARTVHRRRHRSSATKFSRRVQRAYQVKSGRSSWASSSLSSVQAAQTNINSILHPRWSLVLWRLLNIREAWRFRGENSENARLTHVDNTGERERERRKVKVVELKVVRAT